MMKLIDLGELPPITIGEILSQIAPDSQGHGSGAMLEQAISKFESDHANTYQGYAAGEAKKQNILPLQKRGEGQFFKCSDCPNVQETEQELLDHVESYHAKSANDGQSEITHGIQGNNDRFTASKMPELPPIHGTHFMEYYNGNKGGRKSVRKTIATPYTELG